MPVVKGTGSSSRRRPAGRRATAAGPSRRGKSRRQRRRLRDGVHPAEALQPEALRPGGKGARRDRGRSSRSSPMPRSSRARRSPSDGQKVRAYRLTVKPASGTAFDERIGFVLHGKREYQLLCRAPVGAGDPDGACALLYSTFTSSRLSRGRGCRSAQRRRAGVAARTRPRAPPRSSRRGRTSSSRLISAGRSSRS